MYKVIFFFCFLFLLAFGHKPEATGGTPFNLDTVPTGVPQLFGGKFYQFKGYVLVDSFLMTAAGDTNAIPRYPSLEFKSSNNRWYGYDRSKWQRFVYESDSIMPGTNLQKVTDNGNKTTDTIIAGFFKLDSLNTSRTTKDAFIVKDYLSGQLKSRRQIIDTSVARQTLLTWNLQTTPLNSIWANLTWSPELKMIVATSHSSGNSTGIMTSQDGIAWTLRNTPQENWRGVAWSPKLKLFAAIASTGTNNGIMTSPDGITWNRGTLPNSYFYRYIIWVEELGLFVACALTASVTDKILTSPDGITWTARTCPDRNWNILTYAPDKNLLVCAAAHNGTVAGVMTSPDGITWSLSADTIAGNGNWEGLCYSQDLGLFVMASHNFNPAVGVPGKQVAVSADGINWTRATTPADGLWLSVAWSSEMGMFVAVGEDITNSAQVMVSTDAYNWSLVPPAAAKAWRRAIWVKELGSFIGLAYYNGSTPANNLVMTSSPADINQQYVSIYRRGATQNIQGRLNFKGATQTDSTATFGDSITQNVTTKSNLLRSTTFIGDRNIEGNPYSFFMTGALRVYSEESLSANPTLSTSLGLGRYLYLNNGASMTADYNALLSNAVPRLRGAVTMQGFGGFPIAAHQFNYLFTRSPDFTNTPSVTSGSTPAQANANLSLRTGLQNTGAITATGWFAGLELQLRLRNDAHSIENYADIITGNIDYNSPATVTNRYGLYVQPIKQSWVTNAYSIYQSGTADTNYLAGITRLPNLSQVSDTNANKPVVVDANGVVKKGYWAGSGGGSSYTFASGLTESAGTVTNDLITGISGGQTIIGSTSTNSGLNIRATSGVGTTGSNILFQVGNNGATEAMRILHDGKVGILTGGSAPVVALDIPTSNTTNSLARFGSIELQSYQTNNAWMSDNSYFDGTNFVYRNNGTAGMFRFNLGSFNVYSATSGTAGNPISWQIPFTCDTDGDVGLGGITTPGAKLHLPAGTAAANTAPLKLTSGTNLTTPEDGAIEYDGTHYYGTIGSTRYQLDQQAGSTTLDQAIANGNALTTNRTIVNSTFQLDITGSRNFVDGYTFGVTNTTGTVGVAIKGVAADGRGIWGEVTSGVGVYGNATSGYGVFSSATTGNALYVQSTSGLAIESWIQPSSTNTVVPIYTLSRATDGTAGNGIGQSIDFLSATTVATRLANQVISKWTNATDASRTSQFEIWGVNAGTSAQIFTIKGAGQLQANNYGTQTFTGTPASDLQVTSTGDIIEKIAPKEYSALVSQTGTNAPTATVLGTNSIGSIVWTRNSAGNYTGTLTGAFTSNKTFIELHNSDESGGTVVIVKLNRVDANSVLLQTFNSALTNVDVFTNMSVRIQVYP